MSFTTGRQRTARWVIIPFFIAACLICIIFGTLRLVHAGQGAVAPARTIKLGAGRAGALYGITLGVKHPAQMLEGDSVLVSLSDAKGVVGSKWLHAADLDFYLTLRPRVAGPITANLSFASSTHEPEISATLSKILQVSTEVPGKSSAVKRGVIAAEPNDTWQNAEPFELGQTIFGGDDERPYAPSKNEDGYAAMLKGFQWFRFTFREKDPRLIYFVLNVTDRDVPLDVDIFQVGKDSDGQPDVVPFTDWGVCLPD